MRSIKGSYLQIINIEAEEGCDGCGAALFSPGQVRLSFQALT